MIKKRYVIDRAFTHIGLSGYVFDQDADERQEALFQLDSLMAEWLSVNVDLGYVVPASPEDSDLDADSGLTMAAVNAVARCLALNLCPAYGKLPSVQLQSSAATSKNALWSSVLTIQASRYPTTQPIGRGNKRSVRDRGYFSADLIDNTLPTP
jgi:hypothetical protein